MSEVIADRSTANLMLSPHEVATLMLVKHAPCRIEPGLAELHALVDLDLVAVEGPVAEFSLHHVTPRGDAVLRAFARLF
jgi:hypothetical protein